MRRGSRANRLSDYWIGIPLLNLLATARPAGKKPAIVRRVGVMCSPALGGTLLFSGVLQDLRGHFDASPNPPVEIIHFRIKPNLAAAELIPGADRRVVIDLTHPPGSVRRMRAERLDLMLDFSSWQRVTAFYTLCSGAKFTAGFRAPRQFRSRGFDLTVDHRNDRHELENFRALVKALGVEPFAEPSVNVPELTPEAWGDLWMRAQVWTQAEDPGTQEDLVVLHPWPAGAQSWLREWPEASWVEFARRLPVRSASRRFVVTGSPDDQPRVGKLVAELERAGVPAVGFAAGDGLKSVVALLRRTSLAVCVNTGIMHLAAIVGTPTLGLNGPTADRRWGPRGRCAEGLGPADGSGGYLNFGFEYPRRPENVMGKISVDAALEASIRLMACGRTL